MDGTARPFPSAAVVLWPVYRAKGRPRTAGAPSLPGASFKRPRPSPGAGRQTSSYRPPPGPRQKLSVNRTMTGMISTRPSHIWKVRMSLEGSLKKA